VAFIVFMQAVALTIALVGWRTPKPAATAVPELPGASAATFK
jgi:hypothetical protein